MIVAVCLYGDILIIYVKLAKRCFTCADLLFTCAVCIKKQSVIRIWLHLLKHAFCIVTEHFKLLHILYFLLKIVFKLIYYINKSLGANFYCQIWILIVVI